ncbi:MAG: phosphotransferase [Acidimicrobiales bacterium]
MTADLSPPPDPFRSAAEVALTRFPVTLRAVTLVNRTENVTYRVDDDAGRAWVLRLHRPGYHTRAELEAERVWLAALARAGVAVPEPLAATDGSAYVAVDVPADAGAGVAAHTRQVGVTRWIPGQVLADLIDASRDPAEIAGWYHQLGAMLGRLHRQASAWTPPPGFTRHRFDADGMLGERPFWGRFWESPALNRSQRQLLDRARHRLRGELENRARDPGRFSMIHADLHPGNAVVDGDRIAVIDFDDAGFGHHLYDLAVALGRPGADPLPGAVWEAALSGYRTEHPLSDDEAAAIPRFELLRSLALIGWKADRPEVAWPDGMFDRLVAEVLDVCARLLSGP